MTPQDELKAKGIRVVCDATNNTPADVEMNRVNLDIVFDLSVMDKLRAEGAAFDRMLPELLKTCKGKYVAVSKGKVIDKDADQFKLARRIDAMPGVQPTLIRKVTDKVVEDRLESPECE